MQVKFGFVCSGQFRSLRHNNRIGFIVPTDITVSAGIVKLVKEYFYSSDACWPPVDSHVRDQTDYAQTSAGPYKCLLKCR
jgi:hypothetical protein